MIAYVQCLPLRGGKGRQWEGGIRQPLYIAWPGAIDGGATSQALCTGMDLFPTMLDIADLPLLTQQHTDGVSLVPVFQGQSLPERPLFWHYPHYGNQGGEPSAIMIRGNWKLIRYYEDGRNELYDLNHDLSEQTDLVSQQPQVAREMSSALEAWLKEVGAELPTPNPNFDAQRKSWRRANLRAHGNPKREQQHAAFLNANFTPPGGWWDQPNQPSAAAGP